MKAISENKMVKEHFGVGTPYKVKPSVKRISTPRTPIIPGYDDLQWRARPRKSIVEDNLSQEDFSGEINFGELQQKFIDDLSSHQTPTCFNRKISPTLAQLRLTPAQPLGEKRKILIQKHEDIRLNSNKLPTGGGFSMWPEMEKMRLDSKGIVHLATFSIAMGIFIGYAFIKIHGSTINSLDRFSARLKNFSSEHPIYTISTAEHFHDGIRHWHRDFHNLLNEIIETFDTSQPSWNYQIYILSYIGGIILLVYYLFDNIYAKNRLTPKRIRRWVILLTVITCWSGMMLFLFKSAQNIENLIETNVFRLNEIMGNVLMTKIETDYFQKVLKYWQIRCLPPSTQGTIIIFGIFSLHDIKIYLQYYSIPLMTIILSPIIQLILAVYSLYKPQYHK